MLSSHRLFPNPVCCPRREPRAHHTATHLPGGWRPPARVLCVGLHSLDTSVLIVSHPCVHRLTDCRSDVSLQGLSPQRRDPRVQWAGCCTRLWGGIPGSGTQAGPGGGPRSSRGTAPCGLPCPAPPCLQGSFTTRNHSSPSFLPEDKHVLLSHCRYFCCFSGPCISLPASYCLCSQFL